MIWNKHKKKIIIIGFAALAAIIVGITCIIIFNNEVKINLTDKYSDKEYGFSFGRPSDWQISTGENDLVLLKSPNGEAEIRVICNKYFGENNVNFYECKKAEYKGILYQYPDSSMSRSVIAKNPGIVRRLMNHFNFSSDRVITFMKENIGSLHFGNTEGSNTLKGKDILVVGTPYHAEFLYKLVTFYMGLDFDEIEKMTAQIVEHNGYRFRFTTFKNENLRSIHFWMIESELEQAVGRARLLRNKCKVNLFSNFPLNQSQMVSGFDCDNLSRNTEASD